MNPLFKYMQEHDIDPFSSTSDLLKDTGISRVFLGRIATDQRRCSNVILNKIEEATEGAVKASEMLLYWLEQDSKEAGGLVKEDLVREVTG